MQVVAHQNSQRYSDHKNRMVETERIMWVEHHKWWRYNE